MELLATHARRLGTERPTHPSPTPTASSSPTPPPPRPSLDLAAGAADPVGAGSQLVQRALLTAKAALADELRLQVVDLETQLGRFLLEFEVAQLAALVRLRRRVVEKLFLRPGAARTAPWYRYRSRRRPGGRGSCPVPLPRSAPAPLVRPTPHPGRRQQRGRPARASAAGRAAAWGDGSSALGDGPARGASPTPTPASPGPWVTPYPSARSDARMRSAHTCTP